MRRALALMLAVLLCALLAVPALANGVENSWKITAPAEGATVTGTEVTVTVDPGQVKVVKPGTPVAGEGHWHYLVDGQEVGKGPVNSFTFKNLTPGKHVLRVELHQNDHSPYPGAAKEVTVNVALPNTGSNATLWAALGAMMLVAGGFLVLRRRGARA
jgi:LPXTG-motif cell wall-anchored protein